MTGGDQKLAVVPSFLGYGPKGIKLPQVNNKTLYLCPPWLPWAMTIYSHSRQKHTLSPTTLHQGEVPGNAKLYYEVELLR